MVTDFPSVNWNEALREFLFHVKASRADATLRFYDVRLRQLVQWADANRVSFADFGKRHLDRYLIDRRGAGIAPMTLRHDAVSAKAFFRWCQKEKLIERSKLAEYEIRRAPDPYRHMPTDEEIQKLVRGIHDHWNPATNPAARYRPQMKRLFHRDKDYAIILGLLDSACRIGEMLSLKVTDYSPSERGITIRQSKGRTSRTLPVSDDWAEALSVWLKLRSRVMEAVPPEEDEGWIFISETGRRLSERNFLRSLKGYLAYAGVTERVCLHSLRRYSLNKLARTNLLAARDFAGHQDAKTTLIYTKLTPDDMRQVHDSVGVLKTVLQHKRPDKRRKSLV